MERDLVRGEHPLDQRLSESGMLAWFVPCFALLANHLVRLAPFALAFAAFLWLLPHITLAGPFQSGGWRSFVDAAVQTLVSTAIMVTGYRTLASAEGSPYGVGALRPLADAATTLLGLVVFWGLTGWLLGEIFGALAQSQMFLRMVFSLFNHFGVWGLYALIVLLSPLVILLAHVSALSYVQALRSEQPLLEILLESFAVVFGQARRFVPASLLIGVVLVLIIHLGGQSLLSFLFRLVLQFGMVVVAVFGAAATLIALPWWFVAERALRPDLGVEDNVGDSEDAEHGADDLTTAVATSAAIDHGARFAAIAATEGAEAAGRRLVAELRGRRLDTAGFEAGLSGLPDASVVLPHLSALAQTWQEASRPGELAWLIGLGLKLDREFLMDQPDQVLSLGKRLGQQQQAQLAGRLLLNFLNRHRRHPDHAEVGVQVARLMAFQRNDSAGARRLLEQLQTLHPNHPSITAMLRQLP